MPAVLVRLLPVREAVHRPMPSWLRTRLSHHVPLRIHIRFCTAGLLETVVEIQSVLAAWFKCPCDSPDLPALLLVVVRGAALPYPGLQPAEESTHNSHPCLAVPGGNSPSNSTGSIPDPHDHKWDSILPSPACGYRALCHCCTLFHQQCCAVGSGVSTPWLG